MPNRPSDHTLETVLGENRASMNGVSDEAARDLGYEFDPDRLEALIHMGRVGLPGMIDVTPVEESPSKTPKFTDSHAKFEGPADWRSSPEERNSNKTAAQPHIEQLRKTVFKKDK